MRQRQEGSGMFHPLADRDSVTEWKTTEEQWANLKAGDACSKLGIEFRWTDKHWPMKSLDAMRLVSDDLADAALDVLQARPSDDCLDLLFKRKAAEGQADAAVDAFLNQVLTVPDWVNWEQIRRGQEVFVRYNVPIQIVLLHLSLAGGFGAPRINKVLNSTSYLSKNLDSTYRRLMETTQMIVDCLGPDSLIPRTGKGWISCVRVRFLHAKVRQRLLKSGRWSIEEYGIPINQEDLAGTQISFSSTVIHGCDKLGILLTDEEKEDYTHMWRYIGYLMGITDEYNPCQTLQHSFAYFESIFLHLIQPDETSQFMSHHALKSVAERAPAYWSFETHAAITRVLVGPVFAQQMQLPETTAPIAMFIKIFTAVLKTWVYLSTFKIAEPAILAFNYFLTIKMVKDQLKGQPATFVMSHEPSSDNLLRSKSLDDLQQTKKPMFSLASSMFETVACHPILLIFVLNAALERLFRSPLLSPILYKLGRKLLKKRSA